MEIPYLRVFPTENIPCSKTEAWIPRVCEYHQGWKAEELAGNSENMVDLLSDYSSLERHHCASPKLQDT